MPAAPLRLKTVPRLDKMPFHSSTSPNTGFSVTRVRGSLWPGPRLPRSTCKLAQAHTHTHTHTQTDSYFSLITKQWHKGRRKSPREWEGVE